MSLIGARPLTLVPIGDNRQRFLHLNDILSIEQEIETASMERAWVFRESGKAEKVYLDKQYPLVNFITRITLVTGDVITGHVISAVCSLKTETTKKKLFIKRQIKGTETENLETLVYLRSIRMTAPPLDNGGTLGGRLSGFGNLLSATALDNPRGQVLAATITSDNRFTFGVVLQGSYDLCLLTDTHVLVGHSDDTPEKGKTVALQEKDRDALNEKFRLADDFFNTRWIVDLRGTRSFAKTLVYKRRADYYEAERWTPGGFLWHLEVWDWHFAAPDWKLDQRHILIRHKQKGGEQNKKLMAVDTLRAVKPGSEIDLSADKTDHEAWHVIRDLD